MHKFTADFRGDSAAALKTAQDLMANRGFSVSKIGGGEVRGSRSHPFFGGKTNDMIALVSKVVIRASTSQISAEAELGSLRKLIAILLVMIVGMEALFLGIAFAYAEFWMVLGITLITVVPWFVLGPVMLYAFRRMALSEVQKLVDNVAAMAERD